MVPWGVAAAWGEEEAEVKTANYGEYGSKYAKNAGEATNLAPLWA
jgi:hypothetical protein